MASVSYLDLFLVFLKLGFIMFGGGYGGIAIYYRELVEERGWIGRDEFLSLVGIAESTPGPLAINAATWIGYALGGVPGSIVATVAVVIPSYVVILGIVVSLRPYMDHWVARAVFRGINVAVLSIILYALLKLAGGVLAKGGQPDVVSIAMFLVLAALMLLFNMSPVTALALAAIVSLVLALALGA
ncbi:MAG: chromate transporter [Desulfurococcaceae archaeon]